MKCILFYSILIVTATGNFSQAIEVNGKFSIEVFGIGNDSKQSERRFSVKMQDELWEITTRRPNQTNGVTYFQSTFDGKNIYSFTAFDTNYSISYPTNNEPTKLPPKNDSLGIVRTDHYPPYDSSLIQPIWLAFCSGGYFTRLSDSLIPSFLGIGNPNSRQTFCRINVEMLDNRFQIPGSIQIINEGKILLDQAGTRKGAGTNVYGVVGETVRDAPAPYNQGFLNAEYKVIKKTNFNGMVLPLSFEIKIFGMKANATSASDLNLSTRILGVIDGIEAGVPPTAQPQLGKRTLIFDKRVQTRAGAAVAYWASNKWLSQEEAQHAALKDKSAKPRAARAVVLLFLGILSIAGFIGIFVISKRRKASLG